MPTAAPPTSAAPAIVIHLDDHRLRAHRPVSAPAAATDRPAAPARIAVTVAQAVAGTVAGQALTATAAVPGAVLAGVRLLRPSR